MPMAARERYEHRKESYSYTEHLLENVAAVRVLGKASVFGVIASMWHTGVQDLALLRFPWSPPPCAAFPILMPTTT